MQIDKIKRYEMVELTIAANQPGRFNFVTQPQLRNQPDQIIIVKGIQIFPITAYTNSQVSAGVVGVAVAELVKAVLVLYVDGEESVKNIPLPQLVNINATAAPSVFQQEIQNFADLNNVAWEKSYVQFSVAAAGTPYVIPFGITYLRMRRDPNRNNEWIDA
jgi:hypothetical protein